MLSFLLPRQTDILSLKPLRDCNHTCQPVTHKTQNTNPLISDTKPSSIHKHSRSCDLFPKSSNGVFVQQTEPKPPLCYFSATSLRACCHKTRTQHRGRHALVTFQRSLDNWMGHVTNQSETHSERMVYCVSERRICHSSNKTWRTLELVCVFGAGNSRTEPKTCIYCSLRTYTQRDNDDDDVGLILCQPNCI